MGTTPIYAWPYPELIDPPDGASQIKALALAVETTMSRLPYAMAAGQLLMAANGQTVIAGTITFPAGRFTQTPLVTLTSLYNPASSASQRAYTPFIASPFSNTSMGVQINNSVAWTSNLWMNWIAVQMTSVAAPGMLSDDLGPMSTAVCRIAGCDNRDIPIEIHRSDEPVYCGVCGHPIEDIEPTP